VVEQRPDVRTPFPSSDAKTAIRLPIAASKPQAALLSGVETSTTFGTSPARTVSTSKVNNAAPPPPPITPGAAVTVPTKAVGANSSISSGASMAQLHALAGPAKPSRETTTRIIGNTRLMKLRRWPRPSGSIPGWFDDRLVRRPGAG
jgi:hypothetical protein